MDRTHSRIELPERPAELTDAAVAIWEQDLEIDTYLPDPPSRYPMFFDRRVYQGSSGRVYPLAFTERISSQKGPRRWRTIQLDNEFVRIVVLPELGGRIHIGYDKVHDYDFFYRNNVIKPALVGLAGPWISGGVEFNWPQHHRPATFEPVDVAIEHGADGSATCWCSDLDPFARMKGTHGIRLLPGSAAVDLVVRLYNGTDETQTFLWWANVAARVDDGYQSFFPRDVTAVADHAKRATTGFPRADTPYYGIDYRVRVTERDPDADRIDYYRNIPVPTSYMCVGSHGGHFGGYDHGRQAGFVHVADRHISPGKKQWTWGNSAFGHAWDRNLTDSDGPYIELMAGVYTDNQPDFSFLTPGETKTFTQRWYPYASIGVVDKATERAAVSLSLSGQHLRVGVAFAAVEHKVTIESRAQGQLLARIERAEVGPADPVSEAIDVAIEREADIEVTVWAGDEIILRYQPEPVTEQQLEPATEPADPAQIASADELYLTGLHLAQIRHATRSPEPYWQEALRRDSGDSRCATALAVRHYDRGEYEQALELLERAVARITSRNPNPADTEPLYRLGLVLVALGRDADAADAFGKAAWDKAWFSAAHFQRARIACRAGAFDEATSLLEAAARSDPDDLRIVHLLAMIDQQLGYDQQAKARIAQIADPLDWTARFLTGDDSVLDGATAIDVADEFVQGGFVERAIEVLDRIDDHTTGIGPLVYYHRAALQRQLGRPIPPPPSGKAYDRCFPSRASDATALGAAIAGDPTDKNALALLGMWLYDRSRRDEAIALWQRAADLMTPEDRLAAVVYRNLGLAAYVVQRDPEEAARWYERAFAACPDARLLYESDQLAARRGSDPATRLTRLAQFPALVAARDDLTIEYIHLLVRQGQLEEASQLLADHHFGPWEGGEGLALAAYVRNQLARSARSLAAGDARAALDEAEAALTVPDNLGETWHPLANLSQVMLQIGNAKTALGDRAGARAAYDAATEGDFASMSVVPISERTFFAALAQQRAGHHEQASETCRRILEYADQLAVAEPVIDYFATSLPNLLLFPPDPIVARDTTVAVLRAQVAALRQEENAAALARQILARDPMNAAAIDLFERFA